jgi:hypothetical protein
VIIMVAFRFPRVLALLLALKTLTLLSAGPAYASGGSSASSASSASGATGANSGNNANGGNNGNNATGGHDASSGHSAGSGHDNSGHSDSGGHDGKGSAPIVERLRGGSPLRATTPWKPDTESAPASHEERSSTASRARLVEAANRPGSLADRRKHGATWGETHGWTHWGKYWYENNRRTGFVFIVGAYPWDYDDYCTYYYPCGDWPYYSSEPYGKAPATGEFGESSASDVQRLLKQKGYYSGPIDGIIGPASRAAIKSYQTFQGFPATGQLDHNLLVALGLRQALL